MISYARKSDDSNFQIDNCRISQTRSHTKINSEQGKITGISTIQIMNLINESMDLCQ